MTRNRVQQRAIRERMASTGEPYTVARGHVAQPEAGTDARGEPGPLLAADVRARLIAAFRAAGWPVSADASFDQGEYRCYAGPVTIRVRRDLPTALDVDDPDDPSLDLHHPPTVEASAPLIETGPRAVELALDGALPATDLVCAIHDATGTARATAVAAVTDDDECRICGDPYPAAHLLDPSGDGDLPVCPACVFDGDLTQPPVPGLLAYQLDELLDSDLAAPAGWAAVVALLACAAGPGLYERLRRLGRRAGTLYLPNAHWADPGQLWLWLPPAAHRPAALRGLDVGASLGAVTAAVEEAHPDLAARVNDELRASWLESHDGDAPERFTARIWPAVIAYVVTLAGQAADRPAYRPSWHVVESFDALPDHLHQLGTDLDLDHLHATLSVGLDIVPDILGLPTDT